jgi:hypothetical protein
MQKPSVEIRGPWRRIIAHEPVASGAYGTTYQVPDLGHVWLEPKKAQEAAKHSGEELCILVSPEGESRAPRLWLFAGFVPAET